MNYGCVAAGEYRALAGTYLFIRALPRVQRNGYTLFIHWPLIENLLFETWPRYKISSTREFPDGEIFIAGPITTKDVLHDNKKKIEMYLATSNSWRLNVDAPV